MLRQTHIKKTKSLHLMLAFCLAMTGSGAWAKKDDKGKDERGDKMTKAQWEATCLKNPLKRDDFNKKKDNFQKYKDVCKDVEKKAKEEEKRKKEEEKEAEKKKKEAEKEAEKKRKQEEKEAEKKRKEEEKKKKEEEKNKKKEERQEKREEKKDERKDNREERKDERKDNREERKDERKDNREERKDERKDNREERKENRQERQENRQEKREERKEERKDNREERKAQREKEEAERKAAREERQEERKAAREERQDENKSQAGDDVGNNEGKFNAACLGTDKQLKLNKGQIDKCCRLLKSFKLDFANKLAQNPNLKKFVQMINKLGFQSAKDKIGAPSFVFQGTDESIGDDFVVLDKFFDFITQFYEDQTVVAQKKEVMYNALASGDAGKANTQMKNVKESILDDLNKAKTFMDKYGLSLPGSIGLDGLDDRLQELSCGK